jgi:hypothetical protein
MVSCARATRGRRLPSLDARTLETCQAAHPILEKEDERSIWQTDSHGHRPANDENIERPSFFFPPLTQRPTPPREQWIRLRLCSRLTAADLIIGRYKSIHERQCSLA